jgi:putative lipoprotein (rSAM/lipoprotein system)
MNSFRTFFLKKYNIFISMLLALLGFSAACEPGGDMYGSPVMEYGVPVATFIVKGNVKSESTSNNIPDIRVIMGDDTAYTDRTGNYEVETRSDAFAQSFLQEFKDVDGLANGEFQTLDTIVEFNDPEFTGGSGWDNGETEKEMDVKLKPEE